MFAGASGTFLAIAGLETSLTTTGVFSVITGAGAGEGAAAGVFSVGAALKPGEGARKLKNPPSFSFLAVGLALGAVGAAGLAATTAAGGAEGVFFAFSNFGDFFVAILST